ncbi:surface lipoprotein assembly modifier [Mannheimia granulomatis]|uniref:surface lipoprotein assembly modifier n=1 Tax=Mannheimia granulomatis TaxID=85402 RepID=UPI000AFDB654|nr:surface lipoprotein assembly modifier [Mannheimia granulomatis]
MIRFSFLFLTLCITHTVFATNKPDLEEQLKQAVYLQRLDDIQKLLQEYQEQTDSDPKLIAYAQAKSAFIQQDYSTAIAIYRKIISSHPELNSIRIELAIALFADRQDNASKSQFEKVKAASGLPDSAYQIIQAYLDTINQRNEWQFSLNLSYSRTDNVDNVSSDSTIENTGFTKHKNMLPKKAHGIAYNIDFGKDFNLVGSHYLSFHNETNGKTYWDNHRFDDLSNRILVGYAYKKQDSIFRFQPFYDKRWYGNSSFHWSNGIQLSYDFRLSNQWQNQTLFAFEKRSFFDENLQAGNIKTVSNTLIWQPKPQQLFYLGGAISKENTREKQYGSTSRNIRLGWLQEYQWGISTQFSFSFTHRKFHDEAVFASIIPLNKIRRDHIYNINAKIWKRDWHLWGITPKLSFVWKKQRSNLKTLYSYYDQQLNLLFEKSF